jgi:hypothetical protein
MGKIFKKTLDKYPFLDYLDIMKANFVTVMESDEAHEIRVAWEEKLRERRREEIAALKEHSPEIDYIEGRYTGD